MTSETPASRRRVGPRVAGPRLAGPRLEESRWTFLAFLAPLALGIVFSIAGRSAAVQQPAEAETNPNSSFAAFAWLIGEWQADFDLGEGMARPTMSCRWAGDNQDYSLFDGMKPTPDGGLVEEYEGMLIWQSVRRRSRRVVSFSV